jgi:hypothetical protein
MPHGHLTAFFLFEVGDAIDLEAVGAQIDVTVSARLVLSTRGNLIAQLLRNERHQLSSQEREEVLRHRLSYYTSDVVVAT